MACRSPASLPAMMLESPPRPSPSAQRSPGVDRSSTRVPPHPCATPPISASTSLARIDPAVLPRSPHESCPHFRYKDPLARDATLAEQRYTCSCPPTPLACL